MSCCSTSCTTTGATAIGIISGLSGLAAPWYNSVAFKTPVIAAGAPNTVQQAQNVAAAQTPAPLALTSMFMPLFFVALIIGGIVLIMRSR